MDNIKSREDVGRRQVLNAAGFGLLGLVGASSQHRPSRALRRLPDLHLKRTKSITTSWRKPRCLICRFRTGSRFGVTRQLTSPTVRSSSRTFFPAMNLSGSFPDEIQYCLSGSMQLTVWSPPLYAERVDTVIEPGTLYNYPIGTRKRVKVLGDEPFRHICFCPPAQTIRFLQQMMCAPWGEMPP